jgi:hypothetical protein
MKIKTAKVTQNEEFGFKNFYGIGLMGVNRCDILGFLKLSSH